MMSPTRYILFDAANTLIHKPLLWERFHGQLKKYGFDVPLELLKKNHKLLSESIAFPDRTSDDFYRKFNSEVLFSLGIIPTTQMLQDIFESCSYLKWEQFDDTDVLKSLTLPLGVLSNFNSGLEDQVGKIFGGIFSNIIGSENHGVAKPDPRFYELALSKTGFKAEEILYVGDSVKLDMEPAQKLGFRAILIDRDNNFPYFKGRMDSLKQIPEFIIQ